MIRYRPVRTVHEGEYRCAVMAVITIRCGVLLRCHIVSLSSIMAHAVISAVRAAIHASLPVRIVCRDHHPCHIVADLAVVRGRSPYVRAVPEVLRNLHCAKRR